MNKPAKRFRCGLVTASVWIENKTIDQRSLEKHSISITKSYKDGDEWKQTKSFRLKDLPKIALLANEVYKYIRLKTSEPEDSPTV